MTGRTLQNRLDRIEEQLKPMELKTCRHIAFVNKLSEGRHYCDNCGRELLFIEVSIPLEGHSTATDAGVDRLFEAIPYDERQSLGRKVRSWSCSPEGWNDIVPKISDAGTPSGLLRRLRFPVVFGSAHLLGLFHDVSVEGRNLLGDHFVDG